MPDFNNRLATAAAGDNCSISDSDRTVAPLRLAIDKSSFAFFNSVSNLNITSSLKQQLKIKRN